MMLQLRKIQGTLTLAALLGLSVVFGSSAVPEMLQESVPRIEFDAREKDLGTISEGTNAEFEFVVMNTGQAVLIISRLRALCDCTEVTMIKKSIAPGESAYLKGVFKSAGWWGKQEKIIIVSSNATNAPESALKVKVNVESGVSVIPATVSFGEIGRNGTVTRTVKIEAQLKRELKIKKMSVMGTDAVTAKVTKRKSTATRLLNGTSGYLTAIDVELKAKNKSAGDFSGQLNIEPPRPVTPASGKTGPSTMRRPAGHPVSSRRSWVTTRTSTW